MYATANAVPSTAVPVVCVSTRRPSGAEYILTRIPAASARTVMSSPAGQSFRKTSSGPPHETVASRPGG